MGFVDSEANSEFEHLERSNSQRLKGKMNNAFHCH